MKIKVTKNVILATSAAMVLACASASQAGNENGRGVGAQAESRGQIGDSGAGRVGSRNSTFNTITTKASVATCKTASSSCAAVSVGNSLACALDGFYDGIVTSGCDSLLNGNSHAACRTAATECVSGTYAEPTLARTAEVGTTSDTGATTVELTCPSGHRARSVKLRWGDWSGGAYSSTLIQGVELLCTSNNQNSSDWRVFRAAPGQYADTFVCNTGQLVSGLTVHAGTRIDAITPKCRQVATTGTPSTKTGTKRGGSGGISYSLDCSTSPARYVYGLKVRYDNSSVGGIHRVLRSLQVLCR
jgi:hypothetical protein